MVVWWSSPGLKQRAVHVTILVMSVAELKDSVLALPQAERHEFVVWVNQLDAACGDVSGQALDQLAAEIWDQDDRHAPPTHPAR